MWSALFAGLILVSALLAVHPALGAWNAFFAVLALGFASVLVFVLAGALGRMRSAREAREGPRGGPVQQAGSLRGRGHPEEHAP